MILYNFFTFIASHFIRQIYPLFASPSWPATAPGVGSAPLHISCNAAKQGLFSEVYKCSLGRSPCSRFKHLRKRIPSQITEKSFSFDVIFCLARKPSQAVIKKNNIELYGAIEYTIQKINDAYGMAAKYPRNDEPFPFGTCSWVFEIDALCGCIL